MQQSNSQVFGKLGETVNMSCFYQNQMAMHFSWYKYEPGQNPRLISTIYKYDQKAMFYHNFKNNIRFSVLNEKGIHQLVINNLQFSDSATYYCGSAYSNVMEFIHGTKLIVEGLQGHIFATQHDLYPVHPEDTVSVLCKVLNQICERNHSVYWLIGESQESHPQIIKAYGMSFDQCEWSLEAGSRARRCVYKFSKRSLSFSDVGTYCAVVACGEVLFKNRTKLDITGADSTEQMMTFVLLSIVRTLLLLIIIAVFYFWYYMNSKRITKAGSPPLGKAFLERPFRAERQ
ncbi:immunoglobulin kappa light chain-like [Xyrauchen texanus]|uniref:immunoglobulin kappa light chain-like n=1 Tax=Xyrauchen texanus TaxID=154827 RepID=UPI002241F9AE|nr:immunoglobulin kappa light chain-like [Xyrauchen texanus]